MNYTIKTYNQSFLDEHVRIGEIVLSTWDNIGQTTKDDLLEAYSEPNFDPRTKLYAFLNNEIVGFVTSKPIENSENDEKKAFCEFPLVLPEHQDAVEPLMLNIFNNLKSLGIRKVRTRAGYYWGNTMQYVKVYNYRLESILAKSAEIQLNQIDTSKVSSSQFIMEEVTIAHRDKLIQYLKTYYGLNDEQSLERVKFLVEPEFTKLQLGRLLLLNEHKIQGMVVYYNSKYSDESPVIDQMEAFGDDIYDKIKLLILQSAEKLKQLGFSKAQVRLRRNQFNWENELDYLKAEFKEFVSFYEREI